MGRRKCAAPAELCTGHSVVPTRDSDLGNWKGFVVSVWDLASGIVMDGNQGRKDAKRKSKERVERL